MTGQKLAEWSNVAGGPSAAFYDFRMSTDGASRRSWGSHGAEAALVCATLPR